MCTQIKLNHQIWAVILFFIVLMTPIIRGQQYFDEDAENYYSQRVQALRDYAALNARSTFLQRLQPPIKRLKNNLVPCYFKLCPMGKRSIFV